MSQDRKDGGPPTLRDLLDTYGGDPARWPAGCRAESEAAIGANPDAQRMAAEARALDAVLMAAPLVDDARRAALAAQLIAMAERETSPGGRSERRMAALVPASNVVDLAEARRPVVRLGAVPRVSPAFDARRGTARAGVALAASLVLGLLLGATAPMPGIETMLGLSSQDSAEQLVMSIRNGHLATVLDEDTL